ncbi:hypothetical protein JL09_g6546 [Pichia kudriavzevii]|uniref:Uncharacterized protein n=1 Tax=Pichia kudriavzevii TaxID=4909 RepID=A0A099NQS4_PICKU|nr:hypothetical protein JL09_g6546 [Pichia kudriavzevii]
MPHIAGPVNSRTMVDISF